MRKPHLSLDSFMYTSAQIRHRQQLAVSLKGKNILEGMDSINPYNWQSKFSTYKENVFRIKMFLLRYPTGPQILLQYLSRQRASLVRKMSPVRFWLGAPLPRTRLGNRRISVNLCPPRLPLCFQSLCVIMPPKKRLINSNATLRIGVSWISILRLCCDFSLAVMSLRDP